MEALVELHDNIMFYLVGILLGVAWIQGAIIKNFESSKYPISNKYLTRTLIELIWTITPALILVLFAFPSFKLLYLMDEVTDPSLSVLAEGDNGYLNYEYSEFLNSEGDFVEFDSYLIASDSSSFDDTTFLSSNGTSTNTNREGITANNAHNRATNQCPENEWTCYTAPTEHYENNISGLWQNQTIENVNGIYTKVSHNLSQSFYNCQKCNYTICISCFNS